MDMLRNRPRGRIRHFADLSGWVFIRMIGREVEKLSLMSSVRGNDGFRFALPILHGARGIAY